MCDIAANRVRSEWKMEVDVHYELGMMALQSKRAWMGSLTRPLMPASDTNAAMWHSPPLPTVFVRKDDTSKRGAESIKCECGTWSSRSKTGACVA